MSQTTAKIQTSENEESISVTEKSAMSSPGTKSVPPKNRSPMCHPARNSIQGESNSTEDGPATTKPQSARIPVARTAGKSSVSPQKRPTMSSLPSGSTLRPENQYTMKKKRFQVLKKELTDKQKIAQELYNDMTQLREKLVANGKDPGKPETIKIEIGSPKQFQPADITLPTEPVDLQVEKLTIGKELLESLGDRLRAIPKKSRKLCQELLEKQSDFVTFVTSHLITASREGPESGALNYEVTKQLEAHQRDYDTLRSRLSEVDETEEEAIAQLTRSVQHLIDEYERSRVKIMEINAAEAQKELQMQLHTAMEEMQVERDKNKESKERLRQTETLLQKSKAKIRELETQMTNDKEKILSLQTSLKNLEGQMKQKELAVEAKLKDMQKAMKNSEDLVLKVEKQRDTFETRFVELREKMTIKENETMGTIKELSERLNSVTTDVGVEREKRLQAEEEYNELQERYKNLEVKSQQLCELAEKNKEFTVTEGSHTENEMRLFNELQETRDELQRQRQEVLQLQQEKEEIVAVMHQAASREEDDDSREKLAAELVFKSNELQNLVMEHTELKKVAKNAQEKNGILERQLIEIQNRLHSQSMEGGKAGLSAHAIELQQEVSDLRNNLTEVVQQKEELETALTQKQLELEQRDRVMREQSKFLKVRDELLDILKGKVQQQENGELSNIDGNNEYLDQIAAKTEAIQGLYTTLENKQLQIMRLEKMVKLMEDHQDRAQAQRTRLENRIAQLELALQRNKEQRGKGFGIL
ncbi:myosin heavy chain, clone 203-like isoform X2 [Ceratina calcarata]|uniref:Myosin heavy chain, clone 203-like isoform X2 n=1 Tax=Ceratina calcarata TaxID=156304 RepID=A0AAJ7RYA6_9HYME|nr:myosin heavy chain, clone 203-like isoform X2 [Ceratina calcarata]